MIFREELNKINKDLVLKVRGMGLLNACVIADHIDAWDVCCKLAQNGLLAKQTHRNVVRFVPPLTITEVELRKALEIIKSTIESFKK